MFVESIQLHAAPGIGRPIRLENLRPGLVILLGPNASGKSTLGRIIRGVLWPDFAPTRVVAEVAFRLSPGGGISRASLAYGTVNWTGERPRVPEEAAPVWYLHMADLIRPDLETDRQIAREISRALAGGYDLEQARSEFGTSPRAPRGLRKTLGEASSRLREALETADDLARRESDLERLRGDRRESIRATSEMRLVEKSRELAAARESLALSVASLEELPPGLSGLTGDELHQIDRAHGKKQEQEQKLARLQARAAEQQELAQRWSFPHARPAAEEIAAWQERSRNIQTTERELQQARTRLESKTRACAEATAQVYASPDPAGGKAAPNASALEHLARALEQRADAASEARLAVRALAALPEAAPDQDETSLGAGIRTLRSWLASPPAVVSAGGGKVPGWAAVLLAVIGVLVILAGLLIGVMSVAILGGLFLGAGLGLGAGRMLRGSDASPSANPRRVHQEEYQRLALAAPDGWEPAAVGKHLLMLEQSLDRARDAARVARERRGAELKQREAEDSLGSAEEKMKATVAALGLSAELPDLALVHQAQRLEALSRCLEELASARGAVEELQGTLALDLDSLNTWLTAHDREKVADGAGGLTAGNAVQERLDSLQRAEQEAKVLGIGIQEARQQLEGLGEELAGLYARAGVEPGQHDELVRRLDLVDRYRDLTQQKRDAQSLIKSLENALAERPDLQGVGMDAASSRMLELEELAGKLDERSKAVAALEQEIRTASEGRELEDARAGLECAGDELAAARYAAVEDAMGRHLLDHVSSRVSRVHAPPTLRRAQAWFQRFTRNAFQLDIHAGEHLVALDVDRQEQRQLSELSDGTRIQLLLAARLASLEQAEQEGVAVPLFLDEVLSTTDRQRFQAIGACLMDLCSEGRQIFYATADQVEAELWRSLWTGEGETPPHIVDLGSTQQSEGWSPEVPVAPPSPPAIPDPAGMDPQTYAAELGVIRPNIFDPHTSWSLFYLLQGNLPELARCLQAGIPTVGRWQALRDGGVMSPLDDALAHKLDARAAMLEATLELMGLGRGRPLTRECMDESGAITPAFLEPVQELLREYADRPAAFIWAVSNIPRFRAANLEKLRAHLLADGYLSEVEPLVQDEVTGRTQARLSRQLAEGLLSLGEVGRFVEWVWALLETSEGGRGG